MSLLEVEGGSDTDEAVARSASRGSRPCAAFNVRTSRKQFQIMIAFMEEQGDLCKLSLTSHKRITEWDRLRRMLNAAADHEGHSRTIDKWKKVWSDLKNNTKKKALRLVQTPASANCGLRLSQLEYRVLKLMDMIKSTIPMTSSGTPPPPSLSSLKPVLVEVAPDPPPGYERLELTFDALGSKPDKSIEVDDDMFSWPKSPSPKVDKLAEVYTTSVNRAPPGDCRVGSDVPSSQEPYPAGPRPDASGHTTARNVSVRRRKGRALEHAAGALLRAEARWRRGAQARRRREAALERQRLRLRAEELEVQHKWQRICEQGLDLMKRLVAQTGPARAGPEEAASSGLWSTEIVSRRPEQLSPRSDQLSPRPE